MATGQLTLDVLLTPEERRRGLVDDVRRGLTATPKVLSPVWFYDKRGSNLFDEITRLPEYYLTRCERRLLTAHAAEIVDRARARTLVELGSGTSEKTRLLLSAMRAAGALDTYVPLDVSEQTLRSSATELAREYDGLTVHAIVGDFEHHLWALAGDDPRLVAFLGSTIGNLTGNQRARFLADLCAALSEHDSLLLGVDLVKHPDRLLAAYNDSAGITAEFNRNSLHVLNEELDADFEPSRFDHVATWDPEHQWIEMHLRTRHAHRVVIRRLDLTVSFEAGETIRTEVSAKFTTPRIRAELDNAGFTIDRIWNDDDQFLLLLARPRH